MSLQNAGKCQPVYSVSSPETQQSVHTSPRKFPISEFCFVALSVPSLVDKLLYNECGYTASILVT